MKEPLTSEKRARFPELIGRRALCPSCGKAKLVRQDGYLMQHKNWSSRRCVGGWKPEWAQEAT